MNYFIIIIISYVPIIYIIYINLIQRETSGTDTGKWCSLKLIITPDAMEGNSVIRAIANVQKQSKIHDGKFKESFSELFADALKSCRETGCLENQKKICSQHLKKHHLWSFVLRNMVKL